MKHLFCYLVKKEKFKDILVYLAALVIPYLLLYWLLDLQSADLFIPFSYGGDALLTSTLIKGMLDNGWYLVNPFLGTPFNLEMFDFPMADSLHFSIMKLISFVNSDPFLVFNIYFLIGFSLTTVTSIFSLRKIGFSRITALVCGLLFSFMPYHFLRGEPHLFLSSYYIIPLFFLILVWIFNDSLIEKEITHDNRIKRIIKSKMFFSIIVCLLISSSGVYYAFFSCFFILIASIVLLIKHKRLSSIVAPSLLVITIIFGLLLNLSPSLINTLKNGSNLESAHRSVGESEIYGLKISQLLLPVDNHRIPLLSKGKQLYISQTPHNNENNISTLGIIGSIGLVTSIFYLLFRTNKNTKNSILYSLGLLNLLAIILATMGGLGSLIALVISPQIRAYNRISIFIAFFSIVFLFYFFEQFKANSTNKNKKMIFTALAVFLLLIGIMDQTNKSFRPPYELTKAEFTSDREFIKKIEKALPAGSMIFQLPYVPFPENPPVQAMGDYEHFKAYSHSSNLKWSYGAMKGRKGDIWLRSLQNDSLEEVVKKITVADFSGIYIDRNGYKDNGVELETELKKILGTEPIESNNQRLAFYNITEYRESIKKEYSEAELNTLKENVINPVFIEWNGVYEKEGDELLNWRWANSKGNIAIHNLSDEERIVTLKMTLSTITPEISELNIYSELYSKLLEINNEAKEHIIELNVPSGVHKLNFDSYAPRVEAPSDPREMYFKIDNFVLEY
ncbi:hypothetical protein [Paenibacillus fonticola]|uniref:hypothetical protein n=1 Tax=Paenibacillus fonticola TaxID=379896 RepID=UPI00037200A9|nr:hypothetical protein [Paenibacillus fonticola]